MTRLAQGVLLFQVTGLLAKVWGANQLPAIKLPLVARHEFLQMQIPWTLSDGRECSIIPPHLGHTEVLDVDVDGYSYGSSILQPGDVGGIMCQELQSSVGIQTLTYTDVCHCLEKCIFRMEAVNQVSDIYTEKRTSSVSG